MISACIADSSAINWIQSGSAGMYSGAPLVAHFGLGDADVIDVLEVLWPDREISRFEDVSPRQRLTVTRE